MKKFLCVFMSLVLLCTVLPIFSANAEEAGETDTQVSDLPLAPNISPEDIGWLEMETVNGQTLPKRHEEAENNLVFPGPLATKSAYDCTGNKSVYLGVYRSGRKDQYYCMIIYKGTDLDAEPVAMASRSFGSTKGFDTVCLEWNTALTKPGMHTLVTFTGKVEGDYIVPVDGSASMTDIYVYEYNKVPSANEIYVAEFGTETPLEKITLPFGSTTVIEAQRTPLPSHGSSYVKFTSSDYSKNSVLLDVQEAGGYLFLSPKHYGTEVCRLSFGPYKSRLYTVEVCYYADGHHYGEPIPAGEPTADTQGCNVYVCSGCGHVKKEYTSSYEEVFQGFKDVPADSWYAQAVEECVKRNLFQGVNATSFAPNRSMTRAMLVTVLWRYEGRPGGQSAGFSDVPNGTWYTDAVNWAAQENIVNGVGKNKFNPDGTITREQLATILYRYAQGKGLNTDISADPNTFPDGGEISTWAADGFAWALGYELISGIKSGSTVTLKPQGNATRAQVATILLRLIEKAEEEATLLPDLTTALYSGEVKTEEGTDLTWALYEDGLLQIGGTVPENWKPDQWKLPWYTYREQITEVEFLTGVEYVWPAAFSSYPNLQRVKMADTVVAVQDSAFYKCQNLREIRFSSGLLTLEAAAFQSCTALETAELPKGLLHIGVSAFAGCTGLKELSLPENLKTVGASAFKICRQLTEVIFPDSVQSLGKGTFEGCTALQRVILPQGLSELNGETFMKCSSLTDVILPVALDAMKGGEFYECTSLEELVFYPMFRHLYRGTFKGCTSLQALCFLNENIILSGVDYEAFGPVGQVTVYGIPGGNVEYWATEEGYTFRSIEEIMN